MSNFLEHYARNWQRSTTWAEQRLQFLHAMEKFLEAEGERFLDWSHDREKMQAAKMRQAPIGSGDYLYWQGAAQEAGMVVTNLLADLKNVSAARKQFEKDAEEPTDDESA